MRILLINSVCGIGSTGRICEQIAEEYKKKVYEVKIAYGRRSGIEPNEAEVRYGHRIGTDLDIRLHGLATRLYDLHGFASKRATKEFIKWADDYDPDILWLHNLHGYYVNVELLFNWIKERQRRQTEQGKDVMQVLWTLHDCWAFTGHCSHFAYAGCDRWRKGCHHCPQKRDYPSSYGLDHSRQNWFAKCHLFTGMQDLTIITPSEWLAGLVRQSFLKDYPVEVRHNTVDKSIFKPTPSDFREKHNLQDKKIILGVSGVWTASKGYDDFIKLARMLDDSYVIVMVGVTPKQAEDLQKKNGHVSILPIMHTENQQELAEIYTVADWFVNPSKQESFGLTTLEALSCGTKAIVYENTACEEVAKEYGGVVVKQGVEHILDCILEES